jgi:hypothetical protein
MTQKTPHPLRSHHVGQGRIRVDDFSVGIVEHDPGPAPAVLVALPDGKAPENEADRTAEIAQRLRGQ